MRKGKERVIRVRCTVVFLLKGFFSRIRHSFGSRPRLPKFLAGSRLSFGSSRHGSVSCHENHSAAGFSPNVRRRNSFADFWLKKTSLSKPVECKKAAVAEDTVADTRLSKSLEMAMARNGEVVGPTTSTPRLPACDEGPDTDTVPVDLKRAKENNPETSMSWVWQEMGNDGRLPWRGAGVGLESLVTHVKIVK